MSLSIGLDATCWANARGYGRFTRELVTAMVQLAPDDEFICFLDERAEAVFGLRAPNVRTVLVRQAVSPTTAASADSARTPVDMLRFTRAVSRERPDVFFCPTVYTFFPMPVGLPAVITVMDAIAERFPELTLPSPRARLFWRAKVWLALRQARLVLTISDYAAREIAEVHGLSARRIRVAPLAPAEIYRTPPAAEATRAAAAAVGLPPDARWFAYVGGFSPHKHVDVLVRAHAKVARTGSSPVHLLLIGARSGDSFHGSHATIESAIQDCGTADLVHWTDFVAEAPLRDLLGGALAVVLPSASEGFGLPPVEGAATGTPVVATTASPLPQLLAGGGIFVPPGDEAALADALGQMMSDEAGRLAMGARAREQALSLSWEASARITLAALREAAA
jgi:glycosyltransferase involved in cell wall biosynthesis